MDVRPIPSCPGYFATEYGGIISHYDSSFTERDGHRHTNMRQIVRSSGNRQVILRSPDKRPIRRMVGRLVLEAFIGPAPEGCVCIYEDGDPGNNCIGNLSWGTPKQRRKRHRTWKSMPTSE